MSIEIGGLMGESKEVVRMGTMVKRTGPTAQFTMRGLPNHPDHPTGVEVESNRADKACGCQARMLMRVARESRKSLYQGGHMYIIDYSNKFS